MIRYKAQLLSAGGERQPEGRGFVLCNEIQISVENRFQREWDGVEVENKLMGPHAGSVRANFASIR